MNRRVMLAGANGSGIGLVFSPDGKTLASPVMGPNAVNPLAGGQGGFTTTINLWDVATGKEFRSIPLPAERGVTSFAISPDGRTLATENTDQTVTLWEIASGKERSRLGKAPAAPQPQPGQMVYWSVYGNFGMPASSTLTFAPDGRTLAARGPDGSVRVWDTASGKEIGALKGHEGNATAVACDGKTLATGSSDTTILLWDLAPLKPAPRPALELSGKDVESLWAALAGEEAEKAGQGIQKLSGAPRQAVPLFRDKLRPAPAVDPKKIAQWIADLDSEEFEARQRATQELEKLGDLAVPALTKLAADPPTLEARKRAEQILERLTGHTLSTEQVRLMRALEVLEQVGTTEARQVLETLAKGAPGALPTREAQAALDRLDRKEKQP
jgi:hypothetical protein